MPAANAYHRYGIAGGMRRDTRVRRIQTHLMISTWHCPVPMSRLQSCCSKNSCLPCFPSPPAVQDSGCPVLRQWCWAAALSVGHSNLIESPTRYRCSRVCFQQQPQHSRTRRLDVCVLPPGASKGLVRGMGWIGLPFAASSLR